MATAINRTTYKYYTGVPNNLDTAEWLVNPDLSAVTSVPQKYWKVSGDSVVEMTASEKLLKDQVLVLQASQDNKLERVISAKPDQDHYSRIYIFSCDFTKKETWYLESVWASDSFAANGIQKDFSLTHGSGNGTAIIDVSHGKITEEASLTSPSGGSYAPVVTINGAVQTEREAFETSGGHYTIDYVGGNLSFLAAPPSGNNIKISYWYSPANCGPCVLGGPPPGKKWVIDSAEVQFSSDIEMNDTLLQNVLVDVPIFDASGNYMFTATDQKAATDVEYFNIGNILDFTYGSFAVIPAFGGTERGLSKDTIILRWDYPATLELKSSLNMRFKVWTKHGRGFSGERGTVTIYGVETDE